MPVTCIIQLPMLVNEINISREQIYVLVIYHLSIISGCMPLFYLASKRVLLKKIPNLLGIWILVAISVSITVASLRNGVYLYVGAVIFKIFYTRSFVRVTFLGR